VSDDTVYGLVISGVSAESVVAQPENVLPVGAVKVDQSFRVTALPEVTTTGAIVPVPPFTL
jgi:hypothetical protein